MFILNKKFLVAILFFLLYFSLFVPVQSFGAAEALVQCGISDSAGRIANPCDFSDAIELINRIINWIIGIAGVIFTISAIWGGFLYMTSGENPGNKGKAKDILLNTLLGFVIILVSWLIVFTILNTLIPTNESDLQSIFKFIGGR